LKSIKIYLAYKPTLAIADADLIRVLEFAAANDIVVMAHCENADLVPALQRKRLAEGLTGPEGHAPSRPPMVEAEGVCRFLTFAAATGAKAYVVHLSCAEALTMADRFRGKMKDLFIETMIHYLVLDRSYAERPDFEGAKWVLSPPLRETGDQDALWAALATAALRHAGDGNHCPFDFEARRRWGAGDFTKIPNGIGGVEGAPWRWPGRRTGWRRAGLRRSGWRPVAAEKIRRKSSACFRARGPIAPGSDADLV
jgi:dihydropyrimidinase